MIVQQQKIESSILYRFGKPFKTNAIITEIKESAFSSIQTKELKYFTYENLHDHILFSFPLKEEDRIYGLGESLGGINKRSRRYRMWNTDDPLHTEDKISLYGSHPFFIISNNSQTFGILIDYPGAITIDAGFTHYDQLTIQIESANLDLYILNASSELEIIKQYLQLTGAPYFPPKWAFGFQQSRWSYPDEKALEKVASRFREENIPCDAIYMDIDYMDNYKVFSVDQKKFPNFDLFIKKMKAKGIKLLPIIDPGVKIEPGYSVYEEGVAGKYFCKEQNGEKDYISSVWPGLVHFPDFLNEKTRAWWGEKYLPYVEKGISGFWNDMNEPALFYSPERLQRAKELAKNKVIHNSWDYFELRDAFGTLANHPEDYKQIFQTDDEGKIYSHSQIHNLYGFHMTKATAEALRKRFPEKRYFLLSRSSSIGSHRFGAIWMGDNQSWWVHLLTNIQMLVSLNLSGYFYTGADICGFGGDVSEELALRWMQFGVFNPLFRNHSALGTKDQEPYSFTRATVDSMRLFIQIRYQLLPYIYSEFLNSVLNLRPFITPLAFHFQDAFSQSCEDEFFFGNSILVAPVYQANSTGRMVYFPETNYLQVTFTKTEGPRYTVHQAGFHYTENLRDQFTYFIKENSGVITTDSMDYVDQKPWEHLTITVFITSNVKLEYYIDDGETTRYTRGFFSSISFDIIKANDAYDINIEYHENDAVPLPVRSFDFIILDEKGNIFRKKILRK